MIELKKNNYNFIRALKSLLTVSKQGLDLGEYVAF